ncbi:MAG TPA: hypothetical protein VNR67_09330, partial [Solirubrobacterales bacterium]|nr:hypothetical protein [Solirubrobacterales bacterium]
MALQSGDLAMVALGVEGDRPPTSLQPKLYDGVHLRWATRRERGFPWYGFYLFRRRHMEGEWTCVGGEIGTTATDGERKSIQTAVGTFTAESPLRVSEGPGGRAELVLDQPIALELDAAAIARAVRVRIRLTEPADRRFHPFARYS